MQILDELKQQTRYGDQVGAWGMALLYAGLNEKDQALNWLEQVYAERSAWATFLKVEHGFDGLRSDPRFQALLKKVGLA